jgi:hypothetical protein
MNNQRRISALALICKKTHEDLRSECKKKNTQYNSEVRKWHGIYIQKHNVSTDIMYIGTMLVITPDGIQWTQEHSHTTNTTNTTDPELAYVHVSLQCAHDIRTYLQLLSKTSSEILQYIRSQSLSSSIAIGTSATAAGTNVVAIGTGSTADVGNVIVIGSLNP